jgi:hypothetical protein
MKRAGVSRWHPDPMAALEAEAAKSENRNLRNSDLPSPAEPAAQKETPQPKWHRRG